MLKVQKKISKKIAEAILANDAILITAGSGIGVDSGLPDFRGKDGLWKAYPYFKEANMTFREAANPYFFSTKPAEFWFFYGHRYNSYQDCKPHKGYNLLAEICKDIKKGHYHVFTSNVDGHFQKAGFEDTKVTECHGSITHLQWNDCQIIYSLPEDTKFELDSESYVWDNVPKCKECKKPVRPNILLFGDYDFIGDRVSQQEAYFRNFLKKHKNSGITVIELGAGTAVPTVRMAGESVFCEPNSKRTWVRINVNPGEPSWYGLRHSAINDHNIDEHEGPAKDNEFIEFRMSTLPAIELIYNAIKDIQK